MGELDTTWNLEESLENLRACLDVQNYEGAAKLLNTIDSASQSLVISRMRLSRQIELFENLPNDQARTIFEHLSEVQMTNLAENMNPEVAALLMGDLYSEDCVDILNEMDRDDSEAILSNFTATDAADLRVLMSYPEGTVGSLMRTEFLSFKSDITIREIFKDLRTNQHEYAGLEIQYAYIVDDKGGLLGVLPLRNLLFAQDDKRASEIMIKNPASVRVYDTWDELRAVFQTYNFVGLPVVDKAGSLLGVVEQNSLHEEEGEESASDLLKVSGLMGKEEIRSMPLVTRSTRRFRWLSLNIVLNLISASIISFHLDTLEAVIALAVFLPIISDMSGCSGNQAVAVSLRELSLNLIRPNEFLRIFIKESSVGVINGVLLGIIIGVIAFFMYGTVALGVVVGAALALNTVVAVCVGGLVPLLLKWKDMDPALGSGPILTTVTDMCGFLILLNLAGFAMKWLT